MIKGGIFDFDGTLFDSMSIWDTIGEDYLRSIGYTPRENLSETFKSMSLEQSACYYRNKYGVTLSVREIIDGVNRMIEHHYQDVILPKYNAEAFLQKLQNYGVKLCIATATDRYLVESALVRCRMDGYFSEILTCSSVGAGKDKPLIFRKALEYLGTNKQDTLVFEDALHAINTAKDDGFLVAGIYDSHEEDQRAVKELSDVYLSGYSDLEKFWKFASNH